MSKRKKKRKPTQTKKERKPNLRIREKFAERVSEDDLAAITQSCTLLELKRPRLVMDNGTRIARIAAGCGKSRSDVRLAFKALVIADAHMNQERVFFEMKAASLAAAFERELGAPVTEAQVLATADDYWGPPEGDKNVASN